MKDLEERRQWKVLVSVLPNIVGFGEVTDKCPQLEKERLLKRICVVTKRKIKEKMGGCHKHNTLFWKKDPNSNPRAAAGDGGKDIRLSHSIAEGPKHSSCQTVKSRTAVLSAVRLEQWAPRSHCTTRVPGGRRAPCWATCILCPCRKR